MGATAAGPRKGKACDERRGRVVPSDPGRDGVRDAADGGFPAVAAQVGDALSLGEVNSIDDRSLDFDFLQQWEGSGINGDTTQMAGTRGFDVTAGQEPTVSLFCDHFGIGSDSSTVQDAVLTAIFIPTP
jgi:hypothetical protein